MSALDRKLRRDLWRMKGQALAILLVVACAVASFVGSTTTYRSLRISNEVYYDSHLFADVFAEVRRAPETLRERIATIPGVAAVETRVVAAASLDVPGFPESASARLVSIPPGGPAINRLYLLSGRPVQPGAPGEALVSDGFAKAHGLRNGDTVYAVIAGSRRTLRIVGVATSPEYIYQIRPGDLLPDDLHFGVFWVPRDELAGAFRMEGAFNDVALRLAPGASEREVIVRLDRLLDPYGAFGAYGRDRHVSHRFISDEIRQLRAAAVMMPAIFLGVAAFLLNVALSRLVGTQREQIATMKALGYSNLAVGTHYVKLVTAIVVGGSIVGALGGAWFGSAMTRIYAGFYHLPLFSYEFEPGIAAAAALMALGAALAGVTGAVRRAVSLPPAAAMRPEAPPTFKPTLLERLGIGRLLSPAGRMVLRNLGRRPIRAALSTVGIAFAAGILVVGAFMGDTMDYLMNTQFRRAQREDATVTFTSAVDPTALGEIRRLPGVLDGEAFYAAAVTLSSANLTYRTALMGLPGSPRLHRVSDSKGRLVPVPPSGVMLTEKLGEMLGVRPGDTLLVEFLEGARRKRPVVVAALADEMLGVSAYMDIDALRLLAGGTPAISGAFLAVDAVAEADLHRRLKAMPAVAGVLLQRAAIASFEETSAQYMLFFTGILTLFAAIIAAGVVYNAARVTLAERERELASLRVLGFTRGEISSILLGELGALVVLAIPLGFAIGLGLSALIASGMDSDLYRVPVIVERSTYAFAGLMVLAASVLTALAVRRRLDRLDLVEVLKTKE